MSPLRRNGNSAIPATNQKEGTMHTTHRAIGGLMLCAAVLSGACGSSSTSPTTPTSPSTGSASLMVQVQGQTGGVLQTIMDGQISLLPINKTVDIVAGFAKFEGLAATTYTVRANAFGFSQKDTSVSLSGDSTNVKVLLDGGGPDVLFDNVSSPNGVLKSGDKLATPTTLSFRVKVMNPGLYGGVYVTVQVQGVGTNVGPFAKSDELPIGESEVTATALNFRPCDLTVGSAGNCFTSSSSFDIYIRRSDGGPVVMHQRFDFALTY
jgi:hypothetical protein